jgi:hypothetical protein
VVAQVGLPQPADAAPAAAPPCAAAAAGVAMVLPCESVWIAEFVTVGALYEVVELPHPAATTAIAPIATEHAAALVTVRT